MAHIRSHLVLLASGLILTFIASIFRENAPIRRINRLRRVVSRRSGLAFSGLILTAFTSAYALAAPPGFEGFQFAAPYNTKNPFGKGELTRIDSGFKLFTKETFQGNGRVCSTCHIPAKNFNVTTTDIQAMLASDKAKVLGGTNVILESSEIVQKLGLFNINQTFGSGSLGAVPTPSGPFRASMSIGGLGFTTLNNYVCRPDQATPGGFTCITPAPAPNPSTNKPNNAIDDGTRDIMMGWAGDGSLIEMFGYTTPSPPPVGLANCESAIADFAANPTNLEKGLMTFALAAVKTHYTKTQRRIPGVDFICPTSAQLLDMAKFQKWLGRRFELDITKLTIPASQTEEGRRLFSSRKASCVACHVNAGASDTQGRVKLFPVPFLKLDGSPDPDFNGGTVGAPKDEPLQIIGANKTSRNGVAFFEPELDALVSAQISKPGTDTSDFNPFVPFDEGDGQARSAGEVGFNVQSIIEATRKTQFFHNNAIQGSIEDAIAHYFTDKFDNSQGGGVTRTGFRGGASGPAVLADLGGTDAINKMGLFLRALSSVYALADCERYVDEMIFRIDNKLPTNLPLDNCRFALNDAFRMLELVRVSPNPYNGVPNQLALIRNRLTTAITVKNTNTKKGQLLGVRGSLQTVRNSILTTDELPAE